MIIKEAKYKLQMVKQRRCVSEAVYGCDECRKEMKDFPNEPQRLEMTVFQHNRESEHLHFCSWECTLIHIPKVKSDYFISLPYIYCDEPTGKRNLKTIIEILSKIKW